MDLNIPVSESIIETQKRDFNPFFLVFVNLKYNLKEFWLTKKGTSLWAFKATDTKQSENEVQYE